MPMTENSTYFFVFDTFTNNQVLFQPLKMENDFKNVFASLPVLSPSEKSVERLMTMIDFL